MEDLSEKENLCETLSKWKLIKIYLHFSLYFLFSGEKPAAMQHANRSTTDDAKEKSSAVQPSTPTRSLYLLSIFYLIYILNEINR